MWSSQETSQSSRGFLLGAFKSMALLSVQGSETGSGSLSLL